jgi:hypothetical protein
MTSDIPIIGQRESQTLEFKSADSLKKPFTISREVVAMLNAAGGEIWIGIREQDGVATAVDGVHLAEQRKIDLVNHCLDVIEPHPNGEELGLSIVAGGAAGDALVMRIQPEPMRQPYALLKDGGRVFVTRVDHRVRQMAREEILEPKKAAISNRWARNELKERRDKVLRERRSLFWIGIQPDPKQQLDIGDPRLSAILSDPTRSGNRRGGWSFRYPTREPEPKSGRLTLGDERFRLVTIHTHGGIDLTQSLNELEHDVRRKKEIYPLALLEYVVSMTRLAATVFAKAEVPGVKAVLFDLVLTGADGWSLPAHPPDTYGDRFIQTRPRVLADGTLAFGEPLAASWDELSANPDLVGFRIVRSVYQEFGLPEDSIPYAFDRTKQRLLLTD